MIAEQGRYEKEEKYTCIPNGIFHLGLTTGQLSLLVAVMSFAYGKKTICWPSNQRIAGMISLSVASVNRIIKQLKDLGLIEKRTTENNPRLWDLSQLYQACKTASVRSEGISPATGGVYHQRQGGCITSDTQRSTKRIKQKKHMPLSHLDKTEKEKPISTPERYELEQIAETAIIHNDQMATPSYINNLSDTFENLISDRRTLFTTEQIKECVPMIIQKLKNRGDSIKNLAAFLKPKEAAQHPIGEILCAKRIVDEPAPVIPSKFEIYNISEKRAVLGRPRSQDPKPNRLAAETVGQKKQGATSRSSGWSTFGDILHKSEDATLVHEQPTDKNVSDSVQSDSQLTEKTTEQFDARERSGIDYTEQLFRSAFEEFISAGINPPIERQFYAIINWYYDRDRTHIEKFIELKRSA